MTTYVLMAGLPGTGKSTLAKALASRLEGVVLDKDQVRAALFPDGATDYTSEQNDLCVEAMLDAAGYLTAKHATGFIFVDGRTFSRRAQVERVIAAAETAGASWRILHVTCDDAIAEARLARGSANPAKNRDAALYREVKARFEPITRARLDVNSGGEFEEMVTRAAAYLTADRDQ